MHNHRREIIDEVLYDLKRLQADPVFPNPYAVEANIAFFEAMKSSGRYFKWLAGPARRLEGERLLEVNDLLPKWDAEMHRSLMVMERKKFPGLTVPILSRLRDLVLESGKEIFVVANVGCGGMEIERQLVRALERERYAGKVVFVGIDRSPAARKIAEENMRSAAAVEVRDIKNLDQAVLKESLRVLKQPYTVLLCPNDIFTLDQVFKNKPFDVVFHSLFKHHLAALQQRELDRVLAAVAHMVLEYDGYKSWPMMVPQSITIWPQPILLAATIFSDLRYATKPELRRTAGSGRISFTRIGTYLLERPSR
ncbi:MAG: hypothetical protein KGJ13_06785 [Patescibacteria group bacterium]|nr:hypothetical protein [Patescibacteria group bacterium]